MCDFFSCVKWRVANVNCTHITWKKRQTVYFFSTGWTWNYFLWQWCPPAITVSVKHVSTFQYSNVFKQSCQTNCTFIGLFSLDHGPVWCHDFFSKFFSLQLWGWQVMIEHKCGTPLYFFFKRATYWTFLTHIFLSTRWLLV